MKYDAEMAGVMAEVEEATAQPFVIIGPNSIRTNATANVGEFLFGREMTSDNNFRKIRQAHIVIFKATNSDLAESLAARDLSAIPPEWKCEYLGKTYSITQPTVDELAWEFDIQQRVS